MNTKKAREFVKKHNKKEFFYTWERKSFKEIIALLQQGKVDNKELKIAKEELKKVWQMWEELKTRYGRLGLTDEIRDLPKLDLHVTMNSLRKKYFPKPKKKVSK